MKAKRQKTKRLLFCLTLLISVFAASLQGQQIRPKPVEKSLSTRNTQTSSKKTTSRVVKGETHNRHFSSNTTSATTLKSSEGKVAYGFRLYDDEVWPPYGIVKFNTAFPKELDAVFEKDYSITAGAYAKGKYYVCKSDQDDAPSTFSTIDLKTGEEKVIGDISGLPRAKSMTYDYSTGNMFLLQWLNLSVISLEDGTVSKQIPLPADLITIACSYDGRLYGITVDSPELVQINPSNGKIKKIGKTDIIPENLYQAMAFDHETNVLYWAGYSSGGFLATINTETGACSKIDWLGNGSEVTGLHIPFNLCAPYAPDEVTDLKIEPDKDGGLSVVLSWKNPEFTYEGDILTELSGVKIFRDGALIKTISSVSAGTPATYTDQVTVSGKRQYKIVPYNSVGEGVPRYSNVYIGEDYPTEITNLTLAKDEQKAILTWTPPVSGANNAWFNPNSVKYKITRYPDQTVLETAYTGNPTYTDTSIQGLNVYSYRIEAFNSIGTSEPVYSSQLAVGDQIIPPYYCDFSSEALFNLWTVIDNNKDESLWRYNSWDICAEFYTSYDNDSDDWLISSPTHLEAGKYYKLILGLEKTTWSENHQNVRVTIGTEPTVSKQTTILADFPDFSTGNKSINIEVKQTGKYYIGIQCYSEKVNSNFFLRKVQLLPSGQTDMAAISVSLGDSIAPVGSLKPYMVEVENTGSSPVSDYTVELMDENGNILCSKLVKESLASNATASIQLDYTSDEEGMMNIYGKVTTTDDSNASNDITPEPQKVEFKKTYTVSGKITDAENNAISEAYIKLTGFRPFIAETAADGTFVIPEVYSDKGYTLKVIKNGFNMESRTVTVSSGPVELATISLKYSINKPQNIAVTNSSEGNAISWGSGVEVQRFRRDNGITGGAFGPIGVFPNMLVGTVYDQPTLLTDMSWVMDDYSGKHETVNLYVLALDKDGTPTSKVLFAQRGVPNIDTAWGEGEAYWNKFTFPYPIDAPHGFFAAVGCDKDYTLFVDDMGQRAEYPFEEQTQYISVDYTSGAFSPLEEAFYPVNLFIRASGSPTGSNPAMKFIKGYKVYRLLAGDEGKSSNWKELTAEVLQNTSFNDNTWQNAPQGVYRYAIKTEYSDGKSSGYAFSDEVQKDMYSAGTIEVKTNTSINETEGAKIVLKNRDKINEHQYEATLDNSGRINFTGIWKGTYDLTARKGGFDILKVEALEIGNGSNEFAFGPYELKESVLVPYNLSLTGQPTDKSRTLYWNLFRSITDDFESHEDFEINSGGEIGWQYLDGDNTFTYGIGDGSISFPNQYKKMAYIIFNPSQTTPPMSGKGYESIQPYSGNKFLAFMAASNQIKVNDDYLISPELNFEDNFKFQFYARTCDVATGSTEQMRVGYSLTGTNPNDFIWLTGENSVEVPYDWTRYSYDIPSRTKYVTINYVSYDLFMLMIDDVFIGYEGETTRSTELYRPGQSIRDRKCEVYLDGKKVGETGNCNYTFSNFSESNKTVGVRTVYPSGSSEIVTILLDGTSIENTNSEMLQVYVDQTEKAVYIRGTYDQAELFDTTGKVLSKEANSGRIDAGKLSAGIYILKVYSGNNTYIQKINLNR